MSMEYGYLERKPGTLALQLVLPDDLPLSSLSSLA